jgi:hypothetical protein
MRLSVTLFGMYCNNMLLQCVSNGSYQGVDIAGSVTPVSKPALPKTRPNLAKWVFSKPVLKRELPNGPYNQNGHKGIDAHQTFLGH